jgi:hypothetical protein
MPTYLLELYLPAAHAAQLSDIAARARSSAEQLTREGVPVRHRQTIYVPADEMCFCLYEAASADSVARLSRRAAIAAGRIVEARLCHEHRSQGGRAGSPTP